MNTDALGNQLVYVINKLDPLLTYAVSQFVVVPVGNHFARTDTMQKKHKGKQTHVK